MRCGFDAFMCFCSMQVIVWLAWCTCTTFQDHPGKRTAHLTIMHARSQAQDPSGAGANSTMNVQRNLLAGRMQPLPSHISAQCQALIKSLLTVDPAARTGLEVSAQRLCTHQADNVHTK